MIVSHPTVSVNTMKELYPSVEPYVVDMVDAGYWFYSLKHKGFLSYIPSLSIQVTGLPSHVLPTEPEHISFNLREYSSVYEVTTEDGSFPSSVLLAPNLQEIVEEYVDISAHTSALIVENQMSPIFIAHENVLRRMVMTENSEAYRLIRLIDFIPKAGE